MITPTAAWLRAFSSGTVRARFLVKLTIGSTVYKALSGYCSQLDYDCAILEVANLASKMDVVTRHQEIGEFSVTFDYDWFRPIMVSNRIKGQRIDVYLGAADLAESDFTAMPYFGGRIQTPEVVDATSINLPCVDTLIVLGQFDLPAAVWTADHPLVHQRAIAELAGISIAQIDTASFDPSTYSATISHWNVGQHVGGFTIAEDLNYMMITQAKSMPASDHLMGLAELMNGQYSISETGLLTFKEFDATAAAVMHFTADDYTDFKQIEIEGWLHNRITIHNHARSLFYWLEDTASQASYAFPGSAKQVFTESFETTWLNAKAVLTGDITDIATSFDIYGPGVALFCGAVVPSGWPTTAQDADRKISTTRTGYIKIEDEFMLVTDLAISTTDYLDMYARDNSTGAQAVLGNRPIRATLTVERGKLGTENVQHLDYRSYSYVYDYTIIVRMARNLLARFANGMDTISLFATGLDKVRLQQGDFITIDNPRYVAYGKDGIDSSGKWEIISKEVSHGASAAGVLLICVSSDIATPTEAHFSGERWMSGGAAQRDLAIREDVGQWSVRAGYTVSTVSGLDGTLAGGVIATVHGIAGLPWDVDHTYTALRDTYVYIDSITGSPMYHPVGLGAAQPTVYPGIVPVAKVTTGEFAISSIVDIRRVDRPISIARVDTQTFSATRNAAFTVIKSDGWKKLPYDLETYDYGGYYDHATNVRYDAPEALTLRVSATTMLAAVAAGENAQLAVYKNGAAFMFGPLVRNNTGSATTLYLSVDAIFKLVASDYVEVYISTSDATSRSISTGNQTTFSGERIR